MSIGTIASDVKAYVIWTGKPQKGARRSCNQNASGGINHLSQGGAARSERTRRGTSLQRARLREIEAAQSMKKSR